MELTDALRKGLAEGRKLREQIALLESRKKALDTELMNALLAQGETKLKQEDGSWSIQSRTTKTLDKSRLIAAGVGIDVIESATIERTSDPFLVFRAAADA